MISLSNLANGSSGRAAWAEPSSETAGGASRGGHRRGDRLSNHHEFLCPSARTVVSAYREYPLSVVSPLHRRSWRCPRRRRRKCYKEIRPSHERDGLSVRQLPRPFHLHRRDVRRR